jgi:hypothetical protein
MIQKRRATSMKWLRIEIEVSEEDMSSMREAL